MLDGQGNSAGQNRYGHCLDLGIGVATGAEEAAKHCKWKRRSAAAFTGE
jgi:hypothetical protein